jgi:succinylglutamate desuccinylase
MLPGFKNFDLVREGRKLGDDNHGSVHSPADGRIFLPLYQPAGEDAFFLVRELPSA